MFTGKEKQPTVVLKDIGNSVLWLLHMFFGPPKILNEINILDTCSTKTNIMDEKFRPCLPYTISGLVHKLLYYLADGI